MAKKRKGEYAVARETSEERERLEAGEDLEAAHLLIREKTHIRLDGTVRDSSTTTQSSQARTSARLAPSILRPDVPAQRGPVYDHLELGGDAGPPLEEDDDEGGRALRNSDDPLHQWAEDHLAVFLQELLRLEGRGDHRSYTRWMGSFFKWTTLKAVGLRVQLGHWHERDRRCPAPTPASTTMEFTKSGSITAATTMNPRSAASFNVLRRFHLLSFESKCSAYEFYYSLARETDNTGLNEAGTEDAGTEGVALPDEARAEGAGTEGVALPPSKPLPAKARDRYDEFVRMTREWRHLQMLKRAGQGHDPEGVESTKPGECTLLCPACPQPGKNLPEGWKDYPEEKQFLFALFLAIDANFRLKRKDVSSEEKDPGLGQGWAFFCEVKSYMAHVKANWNQVQERSHCVAHDAVDKPDREARGTASSGIGTVDCARHNMKRPNAVGDLQLGERYINMDYMFFKSVVGTELVRFFVSYDIACQWHINLWDCMINYKNKAVTLDGRGKFMVFLVPKFHLPAHIEACTLRFSFNLTRDVGWTDGEALERGWANANPLATSTKEMGPGSRRDTLDDHFNDWNHKKIIALGDTMLDRTIDAVPMMVETRAALAELEGSFEEGTLKVFRAMAELWDKDGTAPNPFESLRKDEHLAQVRRELAEEAAAREAAGTEVVGAVREDMHVTEVIAMGLQLEEQQRVLRFDASATGLHPSERERTAMVERTSKLRRKIFAWMEIQEAFFPILPLVRKREDDARARTAGAQPVPGVKVHDISLWLPSAMKRRAGATSEDGCTQDILLCEYRLRVGQANEALHDVRRYLLVRSHLYQLKDRYARGVKANTRSKTKIDVTDERIRRAAAQYRDAWAALGVLGKLVGRREWTATLKELKVDDVRGRPRSMEGDPVRQQGGTKQKAVVAKLAAATREGTQAVKTMAGKKKRKVHRPLSWIWLAQAQGRQTGEKQETDEALRIGWAKTRARRMRWSEEVDLLEEEMRRIEQYLMWHSEWWRTQMGRRLLLDGPQSEGEMAYALRQAAVQADLGASFALKWETAGLADLIRTGRLGEGKGKGRVGDVDEVQDEDEGASGSSGEEYEPVRPVGRAVETRDVD
ncbi:hypothetical protein C8R44DRAFT_879439 [Mycena epipterygia]|nr:hypothetical protein C8R44DRAFT_879439 [Mycena epipterygia]